MFRKILQPEFFDRFILQVAEELLGKFLVRKLDNKGIFDGMITEVEAYNGWKDKASHASRGKTTRNEIMFKKGGRFYIYLNYGVHWMLNVVVGPKDYPAAILIRGVDKISGPGRLTKYFQIDKSFNNKLISQESNLWIEDRGLKIKEKQIQKTKRIGVDYAGKIWAAKPYRFVLKSE